MATIPGGASRVVGVVLGLGATVVGVLLDVVERGTVDVVVVGAVVDVVVVGAVVDVVLVLVAGFTAADVVEVVDDVDEAGLALEVRLGGLTRSGTVVEVVDVEVNVVVVPFTVLGGV